MDGMDGMDGADVGNVGGALDGGVAVAPGEPGKAAVVWTNWRCLGLGVLAALLWLAAFLLDVSVVRARTPAGAAFPDWARVVVRAVLVLTPPALALMLDPIARGWLRRHPVLALVVVAPAIIVAELPALLPFWQQDDENHLALVVPTVAVGLALGICDGARHVPNSAHGFLAGLGFSLTVLLAGGVLLTIVEVQISQEGTCYGRGCFLIGLAVVIVVSQSVLTALIGLAGGALGYRVGRLPVWLAGRDEATPLTR